ncbi:hypothetical protein [Nocardia sp. NPDC019395]|uniref:hypothetical protein n=1 Tax=Nocardia sp. NPDC019395 TaxID=3154686 RepID=UPI0033C7CB6F
MSTAPARAAVERSWSCDTLYVPAHHTTRNQSIIAKNSDRPTGEAQPLRRNPARSGRDPLELAYLTIEDQPTLATFGSAPHWCWGYEFGINEKNVAIGNEALFTRAWADGVRGAKSGNPPASGILGMELLRLGLERGATASEALGVITSLLEEYGQWGSARARTPAADGAYDNAFVIADPHRAFVLETAGRDWAAREISAEPFTISNQPTIRADYDSASSTLDNISGPGSGPVDFARAVVDPGTPLQVSQIRQRRSHELLTEAVGGGKAGVDTVKRILRDHYEDSFLQGPFFNPAVPDFLSLCMHEHPAGFTWGNTAASFITELASGPDDLTVLWWTPLPPCVGAYIPIFPTVDPRIPVGLTLPAPVRPRPPEQMAPSRFEPESYWWAMQNLLDITKGGAMADSFPERQAEVRAAFDPLEHALTEEVSNLRAVWSATGAGGRQALGAQLPGVTQRAVQAVDEFISLFVGKYSPEHRAAPFDARWGRE